LNIESTFENNLEKQRLISKMSKNLILSQSEHEAMNAPRSSKNGKATKPHHIIYEDVSLKTKIHCNMQPSR
jgi:hypothetical protein